MSPLEAYKYMDETGKTVVAEKIPSWCQNQPLALEWVKHRYQVVHQEKVVELYDDTSCSSVVIKVWEKDDWLNWWFNFSYNTNNANHNVELISYERKN